jgi:TolB protein
MRVLLHVITAVNTTYFAQRSAESKYTKTAPFDTNQSHGRLGQVSDPAFSPDGSHVAYTRTKNNDRWIGVVDYQSKGANFSLLTKTGKDYDPSWSADGRWIAFTSERDGLAQIYIMTSAGLVQSGVSDLTVNATYPAWQP